MREKIVSDLHSAIENDMRQQHRIRPHLDILVDDHVGPDVRVASDSRAGVHDCCRMNSGSVARRLMEEFERPCERQIRILGAQHGGGDSREVLAEILTNDYSRGLGCAGCGRVLGIRHEGEFPGSGLFNAVEAGNFDVRRTVFEAHVEGGSDLRKFHGRSMDASKSYTSSKVVHIADRLYLNMFTFFITGYPPPPFNL